jgi:hypothetical protein
MRPQERKPGNLQTAVMLLCMALLLAASAAAQQATAKIVGTITDPQGAVVPSIKVTVTNTATNVSADVTTDKDGFYQALNLPIGVYRIVAHGEGFRPLEMTTPPLEINQSFRADLKLEVGSAKAEEVFVEAQGSGVETVNPTIGQSVTSRPIVNLPLNGRNVLDLALLQPGVSEQNPDDTSAGHFNVGGGRSDSVTFLLDGGLNNDLLDNGVVLNPNPDSIAEFRILTSNYTAEYGRNGAGVISVVTKSGTNQFHGSAFEFARNTAFDANTYFNKQVPLPRNDLKRHQFGATFGGPIEIPHLVHGKDRFFFFVAYQGQRQTETQVQSQITTFTPAELGGDFSQAVNGSPDPGVAAFLQANPFFQSDPVKAAQAIIDPTTIDPAAQAYIALKSPSGVPLIPTSPTGLVSSAAASKDNNNEFTAKLDLNLSLKDKLSITLGGFRNPQVIPFPNSVTTGANVTGYPSSIQTNNYLANVAYTRTFSPTLLNEFRVIAQRHYAADEVPLAKLPTSSQLGFGISSDLANGPPFMQFDNGLQFGDSPQGPAYFAGVTYAYSDTLTWVKGRNTWKFGAGFSAYQQNTVFDFFGDGNYFFQGQGGIGTGNSFADFLVGVPLNLFEGPNAKNNIRSKATYAFLQDEWRVRKNLVLSLGIRYEYSTPKLDTQGRTYSIVPGAQSTRFPNAPLGIVFPGDRGAPRGTNFPDKDNFGPRIGFAWSPGSSGKTSIRGGIGIFYDVLKGEDNLQFNGGPPFYSEQTANFSPPTANGPYTYYSAPWTTAGFPGDPFPSNPNPTAASAFANGASLPIGINGIFYVNPHLHTPYTYQFNFSVQHELAKNLIAEANYVGSSSKGLTSLVDINPFDPATLNSNPTRVLNENQNASLTNFCTANFGDLSFCPFAIGAQFSNVSFATFSSLEASLTKQNGENRIFGNTYFTLGYTYAHSIDNSSGFRNRSSQVPFFNHGQFRGSSDFDLTHRITFSGGWDLPFDKAWGAGPKRLIRGWSLYPIFSWRTGFPLNINAGLPFDPSQPGPSGAGDGYLANAIFAPGFNHITITDPKRNANQYFNPAAFIDQTNCGGVCTPGPNDNHGYGLPRNFFRGPGRTNLDLALAKTTAITERLNTEFRVEAFNVFNHTEFANPDTNVFSGTFGQITTTDFATTQTQRILQLALRLTF